MNRIIAELEQSYKNEGRPTEFQIGDVVDVHVRIREGEKERVQIFTGTVIRIRRKGENLRSTFTVRRIVAGEGVERVFPFHSRQIETVVVRRPGKVRRAKLYYLRDRVGKATKVKERRVDVPKAKAKKAKGKAKAKAKKAASS
jgi:large subunit ribosomal protein L19